MIPLPSHYDDEAAVHKRRKTAAVTVPRRVINESVTVSRRLRVCSSTGLGQDQERPGSGAAEAH